MNSRQAEFFCYEPAKWAMPEAKIIVIITLLEPDEYVLISAPLA